MLILETSFPLALARETSFYSQWQLRVKMLRVNDQWALSFNGDIHIIPTRAREHCNKEQERKESWRMGRSGYGTLWQWHCNLVPIAARFTHRRPMQNGTCSSFHHRWGKSSWRSSLGWGVWQWMSVVACGDNYSLQCGSH